MPDGDGDGLLVADKDADANIGSQPVVPVVASCSSDAGPTVVSSDKKHWVEISLVDVEGTPVSGIAYQITAPGGTVVNGCTDSRGRGRVEGIDAGTCKITFTGLDKDSWKPK